MELRHLRYFTALPEELHFGRAADAVFVAQSTLSQQIRAFEDEMGVQFFERSTGGVALTEAGRTFLPYARRASGRRGARVSVCRHRIGPDYKIVNLRVGEGGQHVSVIGIEHGPPRSTGQAV